MKDEREITQAEIDRLHDRLKREAESGGYRLNPDTPFAKDLAQGLLVNERRYGYQACPCRLASGDKAQDLDVICPCDYRDADLVAYDACYCGLYVSRRALNGEAKIGAIPERRPTRDRRKAEPRGAEPRGAPQALTSLPYPVWRCKVCGYLCARDQPPELCPVCKAKKDRFERFL